MNFRQLLSTCLVLLIPGLAVGQAQDEKGFQFQSPEVSQLNFPETKEVSLTEAAKTSEKVNDPKWDNGKLSQEAPFLIRGPVVEDEPIVTDRLPQAPSIPSGEGLLAACQIELIKTDSGYGIKLYVPDAVDLVEVTPTAENQIPPKVAMKFGSRYLNTVANPIPFNVPQAESLDSNQLGGQDKKELTSLASVSKLPPKRVSATVENRKHSLKGTHMRNPFFEGSDLELTAAQPNAISSATQLPTHRADSVPVADPLDSPSLNQLASKQEPVNQLETQQPKLEPMQGKNYQVPITLKGPVEFVLGESADCQIEIANENETLIEDVTVVLCVPDGLEISVLDRDADVDLEQRKIRYHLDRIEAQATETIRYRVVARSNGRQVQTLEVYQGDSQQAAVCRLSTFVSQGGAISKKPRSVPSEIQPLRLEYADY
ncbi:MAG: hypothetical protein AAF939_08020 [Planctomycetota bacterium]